MSADNVLTDEQILQAAKCLTSEVSIDGEYVVLKNVNGCIRAIEQAVLQSEQVQSWKKDAQCLSFIEDEGGADIVRLSRDEWEVSGIEEIYGTGHTLREAIDAAMEKEK